MLNKIIFFISVFLLVNVSFAGNKEGDKGKDQKQQDDEVVELDSNKTGHFEEYLEEQDDTLVFEDWDEPDAIITDNSIIGDGRSDEDGVDNTYHLPDVMDKIVSYREKKYETNFDIYPNPATSVLHINVERKPESVMVLSLTGGRIVLRSNETTIDVSGLENGIYFVELVYIDHIETKKFVKS